MTITPISLPQMFATDGVSVGRRRELFALVALGVLESLDTGLLSPAEALQTFFTFENGEFVRSHLQSELADSIVGRGTQLADLFDVLPAADAAKECAAEIEAMRQNCFRILKSERRVA